MVMVECGSGITGESGAWIKFGMPCTVFCVEQQGAAVDRTELINAIVNDINFYFNSSYLSMGLGQIKVKSFPCNVLDISEFEIVTAEPTTVTANDCILVECYQKKEDSASTFFPKV